MPQEYNLIFTKEELNRITVTQNQFNELEIVVDVHGMKCSYAKRFINNLINVTRRAFTLTIIHGYNHGTAIKDMLHNEFSNPHILQNIPDKRNQGLTHFVLAA